MTYNSDHIGMAFDILEDQFNVSLETLQIVTSICGYTLETLEDILYNVSGYRTFDQAGYDLDTGSHVDDDYMED